MKESVQRVVCFEDEQVMNDLVALNRAAVVSLENLDKIAGLQQPDH
jgi:hypothetical protein